MIIMLITIMLGAYLALHSTTGRLFRQSTLLSFHDVFTLCIDISSNIKIVFEWEQSYNVCVSKQGSSMWWCNVPCCVLWLFFVSRLFLCHDCFCGFRVSALIPRDEETWPQKGLWSSPVHKGYKGQAYVNGNLIIILEYYFMIFGSIKELILFMYWNTHIAD